MKNLSCPECGSDDTIKVSLYLKKEGANTLVKGVMYNSTIPIITFILAFLFFLIGFAISPIDPPQIFGFFFAIVVIVIGFSIRKAVKNKLHPCSNIKRDMKQNGFKCNRCDHFYIPKNL